MNVQDKRLESRKCAFYQKNISKSKKFSILFRNRIFETKGFSKISFRKLRFRNRISKKHFEKNFEKMISKWMIFEIEFRKFFSKKVSKKSIESILFRSYTFRNVFIRNKNFFFEHDHSSRLFFGVFRNL